MAENFQDNVSYSGSTLAVSGDAIAIGSTNAGPKSIIFNNTGSQGHLVWQPTDNRTLNIPDSNGTLQLSGQAPGAIQAGTQTATSGTVIFSNSNGISFGMSNSSVVTASYTVPSTAGLISAVNVSAGTTSNNLSAITFSNVNNVSFGLNGSTVTATATFSQTNQTVGAYAVGNTTGQSSSSTFDARTVSFNGAGAVSVGYSNSSIVISAPTQTVQTQNIVVPSAGTQTATSGTVVFSNSNGISFGMSGSSRITASYTVPSTAGLISAINISAGTTSNNLSAITFSNLNGISFGLDASTITASYTVPTQTNQTVGLYALGNTTQNSSTTLDARTLSFNGLGDITVGYSNGSIQISGTQTNQTIGLFATSNTTQNSSTTLDARSLTFRGAGVASVGYSNGSIVISAPAAAGDGVNIIAAGTQTAATTGTVVFSNSNNVTFGMTNSSIVTASVSQSIGLYALGNTTQNSSTTFNISALSFNGLGALSVGYSNGSIQLSIPETSSISVTGVLSLSTNGSTIFIGAPAQTLGLYALGNTTQNSSTTLDARTLSFNGLGIITAGYSNGSIQLSATQSAQTAGFYAVSNTTQNSSTTLDVRTLSFRGAGVASVGYSNGSIVISAPAAAGDGVNIIAAGTQTANTTGTVIFSNSNNVTFGMTNSSIVTASVSQSIGLYALGNTTQNSSTTFNISALSFNGLGIITAGYSNGSIQLSATQSAQTIGLYAVSNTTQNSSTTLDARTLSFQGAGGVSVGYSNGSVVISGGAAGGASTIGFYATGNTTGASSSSTFNQSSLLFEADGGVSLGYSNGSIQVSAPQTSSVVGVSGISVSTNGSTVSLILNNKISLFNWPPNPWQTNFTVSNASFSLQNFAIPNHMTASQANLLMSLTGNSGSSGALTVSLGVYTWSGSTLSLISSDSRQISWTSNSQTSASSRYGGVSGVRYRSVSLNNWNLSEGNYVLGIWFRTTNDGTWRAYGIQGPTIVGELEGGTNHYVNGFSTSSFTTAMVGSINVTDTNYVRTGANALQQPGIIFVGSF